MVENEDKVRERLDTVRYQKISRGVTKEITNCVNEDGEKIQR